MNIQNLFRIAKDNQKLCINAEGRRYSGYWYDDHMIELLSRYKYYNVDITREEPELLVATLRRW